MRAPPVLLWILLATACGARETYVPQPLGDSGWQAPDGGSDSGAGRCSDPAAYQFATMSVHNGGALPVEIYWVDSTCAELDYGTLGANSAYDQPTYIGHVWRFRDAASGTLLQEVLVDQANVTVEVGS